ncbi:hypothetical protein BJF79_07260 [Actinomadura sp. CNU-125]|uniref:single-stranded DNA-binding protein n=1 Tax=Actinomadura sp. CNU-125 TaxID=1904961 RepID=UPI000960ECC0|nr:single-stranded DNA-binding protein [Actinomadura sp. CNU-125]OLT34361.1 hypothetical protein BJF79_07260 [Actinomadura sp. CNU-125]
MINETKITIVGNLVEDPKMRFTATGQPVVNLRIASNARKYNADSGRWEDADVLFLSCSAWRQLAENIAESLERGMKVIVTGRLKQSSYDTAEGEKRTVYEIDAEEVGPSLRTATAKVVRAARQTGGAERSGGFGRAAEPAPTGGGGFAADQNWGAGTAAADPADAPPF